MKDCSSCFTPWADSTIKPSTTGSQLRRLMPVTAVTFAGPQPADITGRSIPARGRGRLSLLRRRDSDALLLARVRDVGNGRALHVALPAQVIELGSTVHRAAIVPNDQVVDAPAMRVNELTLGGVRDELVDQCAAIVLGHTEDAARV